MTARGIEIAAYVGSALFAAIVIAVMLLAPLQVIWTAAVLFGIALVALITETLLVRRSRAARR